MSHLLKEASFAAPAAKDEPIIFKEIDEPAVKSSQDDFTEDLLQFRQDFFLHAESMETSADLEARLICTMHLDGRWDINLTNIKGCKVAYLLGRTFTATESLPLASLIASEQRQMHDEKVISILKEGQSSPYWKFLFNTMMSRTIKIISPYTQTVRFVKIKMKVSAQSVIQQQSHYCFDVTLTDQTATNVVANKAGLLTHDLRGYIRSGLNLLDSRKKLTREDFQHLTMEDLGVCYDELQEQEEHLQQLLQASLELCRPTRDAFTPEIVVTESLSEMALISKELKVQEKILSFLQIEQTVQQTCELTCHGDTNSQLSLQKIKVLEHFLLNLIRNAVQAGAHKIDVYCKDEAQQLVCEVVDDGPGIESIQMTSFFTRAFPAHSFLDDAQELESKRGEGTLMAYQDWQVLGGEAVVTPRLDGLCGTRFQLSMHANYPRFFSCSSFNSDQLHQLSMLSAKETPEKNILLVDDSLMLMKVLLKELSALIFTKSTTQRFSQNLRQIVALNWQEQGFIIEEIGGWNIICASNGQIALDIVKSQNIGFMITDHEMPKLTGLGLIAAIRELECTELRPRMKIVLNTALTKDELMGDLSKIDCFLMKGDKLKNISFIVDLLSSFPSVSAKITSGCLND